MVRYYRDPADDCSDYACGLNLQEVSCLAPCLRVSFSRDLKTDGELVQGQFLVLTTLAWLKS